MKVSDFIADVLKERGIDAVFSVTGGYAMHLNDSFGRSMQCYFSHGENPCGYMALGHVKASLKPAVVCVTAGCGATNAVTPCLIAYQDSAPLFFISGQVNRDENIRYLRCEKNTVLRTFSGSECDIVEVVKPITKFAVELWDPLQARSVLEECFHHLTSGRPGPVWLSVPLNVQGAVVDEASLVGFSAPNIERLLLTGTPALGELRTLWADSKRPLILAGNGLRLGHVVSAFSTFLEQHKIPVVASFLGTDAIPDTHPCTVGRVGILGDRAGNFAVQNCDLLLCLGCRLPKSIVGYRADWFAREARIVLVDIDAAELNKPSCADVLKVHCNLTDFFTDAALPVVDRNEWLMRCTRWRKKWFREMPPLEANVLNPYAFLHTFYSQKPAGAASVASSGSLFCVVWHMVLVKPGDRFIASTHGDMGFELPAAVGAAIQLQQPVYCMVGDGAFQLNAQELQTICTLRVPVKIMYFNNGGYGAIKITQTTFFGAKNEFGVDPASGIGFPDIKRVCAAYDLKYFRFDGSTDVDNELPSVFAFDGPCLVEIVCCMQARHPKLSNKLLPNGTFMNLPPEDMAPFLEREEFRQEMCIQPLTESEEELKL
jgi:acetolactate synthase-1/2/3 large subunit